LPLRLLSFFIAHAFCVVILLATYPLDVIRRRMQVAGMKGVGFEYSGTLHAIRTIAKHEGIRGLYKGMLPNILKVAPTISVSFVTYEAMKKILKTS
jgi:solute carrier family 25 phosphate transporter 23/24/25/41